MKRHRRHSFLASAALVTANHFACAQALPDMIPFDGTSGYQEIALGPDTWYLAFHGTSKHTEAQVDAAFWLRASQLCARANRQHIVELVYIGEKVFKSDPPLAINPSSLPSTITVALPLWFIGYISNEIANPTRWPLSYRLDSPSRMAPIRCISDPDGNIAGVPPVSIEAAKEKAQRSGFK